MVSTFPVQKLSFILLTRLILGYYKKVLLTSIFVTSIPFLIHPTLTLAKLTLQFYVIFFCGLLLSYVVHEYLHIQCLKRNRRGGEVQVEFSFMKISLYPKFQLSKKEMIRVALLPALLLPIVGLLMISIGKWTEQTFLILTGYIYIFHVINIIPPLGDGMMLIKALLIKKTTIERRWKT
ncbi:metalloprotease family protein [Bacillus sp. 2205SS5-2]|uniref:metalloprotease family protein n=1 Tax=Bacillus sp. 2205SS5-2 TaxID=3109031 RepID=UPI003FA5C9CD